MGSLFRSKPQIQCSHILIKGESKARKVLAELEAGGDFAKLAEQNSICSSRAKGGDLGKFHRGMMVPEFDRAAFALEVGAMTGLVSSQFGYHIIKRTA